jgi:hypothetical protein
MNPPLPQVTPVSPRAEAGFGLVPVQGAFRFAACTMDTSLRNGFSTPVLCWGNRPGLQECGQPWVDFRNAQAPIEHSAPSAVTFAVSFRSVAQGVAVGGYYLKADDPSGSVAFTSDGPALVPHPGSTSRVREYIAYKASTNTWITVGPNGTDGSADDGRTWRPLRPNPTLNDAPGADRDWNAVSFSFVVGPGRSRWQAPRRLSHP